MWQVRVCSRFMTNFIRVRIEWRQDVDAGLLLI